MTAILNSHIHYRNGYIDVIAAVDDPITTDDAELVKSGCMGWGESNAVVRVDDQYYLATVEESRP